MSDPVQAGGQMKRRTLLGAAGVLATGALGAYGATPPGGPVGLQVSRVLGRYGFGEGHPLGLDRQGVFETEARGRGLYDRAVRLPETSPATEAELLRFHREDYVARVRDAEALGLRELDDGDTPVFPGVYDVASSVVGAALDGMRRVVRGELRRVFQPIGGLHHAGRGHAAGFCVFSDLGVVIESLRAEFGIRRIGYVDIDVHHGDGVYYAFERDPDLIFADIHQDGKSLYPGTGAAEETGLGRARGTKLNLPLPARSADDAFLDVWPRVEHHLAQFEPEVLLFQCGADGLDGDPLGQLRYSPEVHRHATRRLSALADRFCGGRLLVYGGGGYDRANLARAWSAVLEALLDN